MSACKNTAVRLILPLLSKSYRQKKPTTELMGRRQISIQSINKSTNIFNIKNNLKQNFNLFHTTVNFNSIVSFNLSDIGEGIREVVVKEWYVKEGDKVAQFDNICEVQSDKASVTITSRYDGIITKLYHAVDGIALVGKPLIDIDTGEYKNAQQLETPIERKTEDAQKSSIQNNTTESTKNIQNDIEYQDGRNRGFAIPSVRRIANEHKVRLIDVKATGKDGRVLKEDILNHIKLLLTPNASIQRMDTQSSFSEPIRGYTRTMIKTMTEAMKIPHFVYNDELSVSNLVKLREIVNLRADKAGVRITYLPFFVKATSNALSRYPVLNSTLDKNLENIIYNTSHNIGIAMDTPIGLAVPVIKNVQHKGIIEISKDLSRLQNLGKQSKFTQEDMSDGTFTFSNIGAIGGTYASPIILPPQRAIIALGAFKKLPRFDADGAVVAEHIAYLSGAADHRIVDGATMAHFCNFLKNQIEEPFNLFLNI